MKLLDSLLDAIVRLEGDALVMHVGEKPYVVTASSSMNAYRGPLAWGQVELSSRVLTFDAVSNMLGQILSADQQQALTEFGAIEHEIPSPSGIADRFTVIAARGGEDVWVELRRRPIEVPHAVTPEAEPLVQAPAEPVETAPAGDVAARPPEPAAAPTGADEIPAATAATAAEAAMSAPAEPAAEIEPEEIELVAEPADQTAAQPAADVPLEPNESIVVAIPGQVAEEFTLNAVPDHAIQIVDEEPQGVPTEEEVDAMLAATASALLTSGLAGEVIADDEAEPEIVELHDDETEIVLTVESAVVGVPVNVEVPIAESEVPLGDSEFELSPPPLVAPVAESVAEDIEPAPEPPIGTPLFSDEAVLAAATPPPVPVAEEMPVAQSPPVVEQAAIAETPPVVEETPIVPPAVQVAPIVEPAFADDALPHVDVTILELEEIPSSFEVPPVDAVMADVSPAQPADVGRHEKPAQAEAPMRVQPPDAIEAADVSVEVLMGEETAPAENLTADESRPSDVPVADQIVPRAIADVSRVADETSIDAVGGDALNKSAQTVAEPTPPVWMTSGEMPMEVTPELHGQQAPVGEVAHWAAGPERPLPEAVPILPEDRAQAADETRQAVVVPLARTPIKPESIAVPFTPSEDAALMHTLRVAAARGASTVYVVAQSKPMIRIEGEITPLESEPTLTAADVDRLVMELAPPRRRDTLQNGPVEWLCDIPEIGRVRCLTFKDHRGPGVLFRMFPPRAISADQLGLTPEVQSLCQQSDGLVVVTGARASGKSTLLNAFVDLINRTRSDHLITIESQIGFVHESRRSFISQRESRGDAELAATYARAALREDPDVMMIEDLKSAELVSAALEAAESGRLVLASVPASSTIGALERLIEVFPADRRAKARTSLATALRGVIAQVLLRRLRGGRVAAREILLNTPAVAQLILEGKMFQLPVALDSGRRHGMVPLTDSLAAHVRDGTVHVGEAYRKALDRAALVALLKREGIDTSFAERLA